MPPDTLVIDLLRPSGALHTIVVQSGTHWDYLIVADIADAPPPESAGQRPVDIGSLRLLNADGMHVSAFLSRPRRLQRRPASSVYDVDIEHTAAPRHQGVYYLGFPPEWSVCSVRIPPATAGGANRPWTGLHSHADDSSWIQCTLDNGSSSSDALAILVSADSDPAHGLSPLPEFGVLHHRHSPIELVRSAAHDAGPAPGAFGVKIDLKAVSRSLGPAANNSQDRGARTDTAL